MQRAQTHTVDCHVFFQTRTHFHQQKCEEVFKSPFVRIKSMTPSNKFTFDFFNMAENV